MDFVLVLLLLTTLDIRTTERKSDILFVFNLDNSHKNYILRANGYDNSRYAFSTPFWS